MQHFSIKFRLSLAFYLLLLLVLSSGIFSIICLNEFNDVADQVRNRWLPDTRFIGDLNNYTSDFRAAEGTLLLSSEPFDIANSQRIMDDLDRNISKARHGYEQTYHNPKEIILYKRFSEDWSNYRKIATRNLELMRQSNKEDAMNIYKASSRAAYDAASDTLGLLTELNAAEAKDASERAAETYYQVRVLTISVMGFATLMVIIGVWYIRVSISVPMLGLADNMRQLAHNNTDVDIQGFLRRDEIGEMARAVKIFRSSLIDLALSREGLAQQASMLEEKLKHERNLMEAQRNFISTASHEFRTPLNIIDGHAQRLAKIKDAPPDITERVPKIRMAVSQMTGLIDNLVNASRLFDSAPELYFHPVSLDLVRLLSEVCEQHREIVHDAQITLSFSARPLPLSGDPALLKQMFGNLISNAVKYSPSGSAISVHAIEDGNTIKVTVQDWGMGIPAKDMANIFSRYFRGSNVTDISGTGIGLYLAETVVHLHGGSIHAESVEDKGSLFTVILPLHSASAG